MNIANYSGKFYRVYLSRIDNNTFEVMVFPGYSWLDCDVMRTSSYKKAHNAFYNMIEKWEGK